MKSTLYYPSRLTRHDAPDVEIIDGSSASRGRRTVNRRRAASEIPHPLALALILFASAIGLMPALDLNTITGRDLCPQEGGHHGR